MKKSGALVAFIATAAAAFVGPAPAQAGPLVDAPATLVNSCKPAKEHPYPVVLVHGQAGNFEGMNGVSDRLVREGYCVYAMNYGAVPGGANGQDHLWLSGDQISGFIDFVLTKTGAPFVDVVGHSAGTGVLDNVVIKKGKGNKVHSFVSFGGLHHPYAHLGVPRFADFDVYLPNLLAFGRKFFPGITVKQVTNVLVSTFGLDPTMAATVKSPFVEDLFDADYWNDLHGGPSEPPDVLVRFFTNGHTLPTRDSMPGICYTNIVGIGDFLVGGSTGWQDPTPSVDNYLLTTAITANTHNDMLGSEDALNKMLEGLNRNCGNGSVSPKSFAIAPAADPVKVDAADAKAFEEQFLEALRREPPDPSGTTSADGNADASDKGEGGCSVSRVAGDGGGSAMFAGGLALGVAALIRRRRERP